VYRLIGVERGDLNGTHDALVAQTKNLEQDRTVNAFNEITDVGEGQGQTQWVTPAYDAAGNMTTLPKPSDPTTALTLVYDAWNRLVEVKQGSDTMAEYEYDGLGRRTVRGYDTASPGSPDGTLDAYEHFFYGGKGDWSLLYAVPGGPSRQKGPVPFSEQVIETRDAASANAQPESVQPKYQYVWSARYIDAAVLRDENTDQDGTCDDGRLYYVTDGNHNVTALVDTAGEVQERYAYDPYGEVTIYNDDWSDTRSSSAEDNSLLYTGREHDEATRLYYYRARWYDAGTGQFTSRDPAGFAAGDPNLYRYVGNNCRVRPTHVATNHTALCSRCPVPSPRPPHQRDYEASLERIARKHGYDQDWLKMTILDYNEGKKLWEAAQNACDHEPTIRFWILPGATNGSIDDLRSA